MNRRSVGVGDFAVQRTERVSNRTVLWVDPGFRALNPGLRALMVYNSCTWLPGATRTFRGRRVVDIEPNGLIFWEGGNLP